MTNDSSTESVVRGSKSGAASNHPDYDSISLPAKPPADYSWQERRAELLQLIRQAGHPRSLNQSELAERYEVSQQQISKDFDRLADHVDEHLGNDRALVSEAVFQRAIRGLIEDEEWRKAAQTAKDWNEWVAEYQDLQEIHERITRIEEAQGLGEDR